MTINTSTIEAFLDRVSGLDQKGGDARFKQIIRKIVGDMFATIEQFNISEDEFWRALNLMAKASPEFGLFAPGLGFEHFLDLRMDDADAKAGIAGGTPRTIEGPLYVEGAPFSNVVARLDDGSEAGLPLSMQGKVLDTKGQPVGGAIVDVWHANTRGNYSHFDPSQSPFNFRGRIRTGTDGSFSFRSLLPSGYSVPPGTVIEQVLQCLGRHGSRPAHIHFFVSAPGYRHLTTQINVGGDPLVHDDFAFATRDGLIVDAVKHDKPADPKANEMGCPYVEMQFDFVLLPAEQSKVEQRSLRTRANA